MWGDTNFAGVFDIYRRNDMIADFREKYLHPYIKLYSFADLLKKMCIEILGLHPDQCYGTNDDKNTLTNYKWEDMVTKVTKDEYRLSIKNSPETFKTSDMTAREVLQYVGTNIFRRMNDNIWADATIRLINQEDTELAIITDCRFPNEVDVVQKAGGKVIKFTRNPYPNDNHISETALDKDKYDWEKFDYVLDNKDMSINKQNEALYNILREWNYVPNIT